MFWAAPTLTWLLGTGGVTGETDCGRVPWRPTQESLQLWGRLTREGPGLVLPASSRGASWVRPLPDPCTPPGDPAGQPGRHMRLPGQGRTISAGRGRSGASVGAADRHLPGSAPGAPSQLLLRRPPGGSGSGQQEGWRWGTGKDFLVAKSGHMEPDVHSPATRGFLKDGEHGGGLAPVWPRRCPQEDGILCYSLRISSPLYPQGWVGSTGTGG